MMGAQPRLTATVRKHSTFTEDTPRSIEKQSQSPVHLRSIHSWWYDDYYGNHESHTSRVCIMPLRPPCAPGHRLLP